MIRVDYIDKSGRRCAGVWQPQPSGETVWFDESDLHCGAAVAFGLMGMAFAIQQWERERPRRELDAAYERVFGFK